MGDISKDRPGQHNFAGEKFVWSQQQQALYKEKRNSFCSTANKDLIRIEAVQPNNQQRNEAKQTKGIDKVRKKK
jgi:hypothetical protein